MAKTKKKKDFKPVEEKLRTEREELLQQMGELDRQLRSAGEDGEPGSYDDDSGEPETTTYERERDLSLHENLRDLLEKVERALERIGEGTYGTCESCGKQIEAARLKALPHATLCISCKRAEERRR